MVANSAAFGEMKQGTSFFSVPFAPKNSVLQETGSTVPSCVGPLIIHYTKAESIVLTHGLFSFNPLFLLIVAYCIYNNLYKGLKSGSLNTPGIALRMPPSSVARVSVVPLIIIVRSNGKRENLSSKSSTIIFGRSVSII